MQVTSFCCLDVTLATGVARLRLEDALSADASAVVTLTIRDPFELWRSHWCVRAVHQQRRGRQVPAVSRLVLWWCSDSEELSAYVMSSVCFLLKKNFKNIKHHSFHSQIYMLWANDHIFESTRYLFRRSPFSLFQIFWHVHRTSPVLPQTSSVYSWKVFINNTSDTV